MYREQFTPREMEVMRLQAGEEEQYTLFYINWSLKEAYVKALGVGIGIDLRQVHFEIQFTSTLDELAGDISLPSHCQLRGRADVIVEGTKRLDWNFNFFAVDERHVVSIAMLFALRGPPEDKVPEVLHKCLADLTLKDAT